MVALETVSIADGDIAVTYLQQVGPDPHSTTPDRAAQIDAVASQIADFIGEARATIDVAIYDFRLRDEAARIVSGALRAAAKRGVVIRIAYDAVTNAGNDQARPAVPISIEADKKSPGTEIFVSSFKDIAEIRPITGYRALMHNKYMIRDGLSADAAVFTGSANFTNDSWGLQENNLLFINSQELSSYYATDFAELWSRHKVIESTGYNDTGTIHIRGVPITVIFTPGESSRVVMEIVGAIGVAQKRLHVASVVISSGPILAALSEAIDRGIPLAGLYDGPQMDQVVRQWKSAFVGADKINTWEKVAQRLVGKRSIPYDRDNAHQPHNFMHNKLVIADDKVVTGSYNLSNHAMGNAENVLLFRNRELSDKYEQYIEHLIARYRA